MGSKANLAATLLPSCPAILEVLSMVELGRGRGVMQMPRWEPWFFSRAVEQSVLRFVLVPPSQGCSSACGRTAMETLVRIGACRLLLSMNTYRWLGLSLMLFEMWVKSVDEMIPCEWFPADVTFTGSLPFCPEAELTDESSSPEMRLERAEWWWSCRVLPPEPEEVLRVLHSTRHSWIQGQPQSLPRCEGESSSSQPGIAPKELPQHFSWGCAGGTSHLTLSVRRKLFRDDKNYTFQGMERKSCGNKPGLLICCHSAKKVPWNLNPDYEKVNIQLLKRCFG